MARPRSVDKESAILSAAIRTIASRGLSAPTALIAKEAGVSNGSLFTYFETKADLLNRLYVELKAEMAAAALGGLKADGDPREQLLQLWVHWLRWATACPEKRRTLAQLDVSEEITPESHQKARQGMEGIAKILERGRETGAMRDAPLPFVVALMNALADTTVDFMLRDPDGADVYCMTAFDGMWRMLA